jgi:hypothetical protein
MVPVCSIWQPNRSTRDMARMLADLLRRLGRQARGLVLTP